MSRRDPVVGLAVLAGAIVALVAAWQRSPWLAAGMVGAAALIGLVLLATRRRGRPWIALADFHHEPPPPAPGNRARLYPDCLALVHGERVQVWPYDAVTALRADGERLELTDSDGHTLRLHASVSGRELVGDLGRRLAPRVGAALLRRIRAGDAVELGRSASLEGSRATALLCALAAASLILSSDLGVVVATALLLTQPTLPLHGRTDGLALRWGRRWRWSELARLEGDAASGYCLRDERGATLQVSPGTRNAAALPTVIAALAPGCAISVNGADGPP